MTADIINLRKARKTKARKNAVELAAGNRLKFGRSKGERQLATATADLDRRRLEGSKLDTSAVASALPRTATAADDPKPGGVS